MDVVKTIRPGQHGSHRFLEGWGDRLVAVRYRKDNSQQRIYTTIEVIVDERLASTPTLNHRVLNITGRNRAVAIRVRYEENELRQKVKEAGAVWSPRLKLWLLRYTDTVKMGLRDRIVKGAAEQCTDVNTKIQIETDGYICPLRIISC